MPNLSVKNHKGLVELFILDTTAFVGGAITRVCNSRVSKDEVLSESSVTWSGDIYITLPFDSANWKRGGDRSEKPKIILPDGAMVFFTALLELGGAPGATITRYQIMAEELLADAAAISVDRYVLDKPSWDGGKLTLELNAPHAFRKTKFPAKQMMRDEYPGLGVQVTR